jgi:hypothetical protein
LLRLTDKEPALTSDDDNREQLPQAFIDRLKAQDRPVPLITSRIDREILQMAEKQFGRRRPERIGRPAWAAIAATVLIALFVAQFRGPQVIEPGPVYADIDQSGHIDIADVLALARTQPAAQLSQAELDAFAMRIVSLAPPGDRS